jgi:hypothetical protein
MDIPVHWLDLLPDHKVYAAGDVPADDKEE